MLAPGAVPGWALLLVAGASVAMLLEAVLLLAWHRRTGRGLAPRTLLPTLVAGGALMAALLAVLAGAPAFSLLPLLAVAGIAHVVDLRRRWPPADAPAPAQVPASGGRVSGQAPASGARRQPSTRSASKDATLTRSP